MINILITESGGAAAIGLIKSIKKSKYTNINIISVDTNILSAGNYLSDYSYSVPKANNPTFFNHIIDIINQHNIDIIIPTGEHDISIFAKNKLKLEELKCIVFSPDIITVDICQNKSLFFDTLRDTSIPIPYTFTKDMIIKPTKGSGSRGIKKIKLKNEIIQEYLPGKEYTVDVFCDNNSNLISHVIRERLEIKAGISTKGKVVKDKKITYIIKDLIVRLNLKGPSCIQFRKSKNGQPKVIECNPRLGGGTFISTLAGINCADIYFDLLKGKKPKVNEPKEITVIRYYDEIVI